MVGFLMQQEKQPNTPPDSLVDDFFVCSVIWVLQFVKHIQFSGLTELLKVRHSTQAT